MRTGGRHRQSRQACLARKALDYIFGYTAANDVSSRDWQREKSLGGGQFARGKSFDGFCPLGPWIVTSDEIPNPNALKHQDDSQRPNHAGSHDGRHDFRRAGADRIAQQHDDPSPGAVILTGTPQGVGFARTPPVWMKDGDKCVVEIEKIGRLENPVTKEV